MLPIVADDCSEAAAEVEGKVNKTQELVFVLLVLKGRLNKCYSTVTLFARLRGWSISVPLRTAVW